MFIISWWRWTRWIVHIQVLILSLTFCFLFSSARSPALLRPLNVLKRFPSVLIPLQHQFNKVNISLDSILFQSAQWMWCQFKLLPFRFAIAVINRFCLFSIRWLSLVRSFATKRKQKNMCQIFFLQCCCCFSLLFVVFCWSWALFKWQCSDCCCFYFCFCMNVFWKKSIGNMLFLHTCMDVHTIAALECLSLE